MSDELKPCPFCGSTKTETLSDYYGDGYGIEEAMYWVVSCTDCQGEGKSCEREQDAVDSWNSRPIEDALQARITELEEANAELKARISDLVGVDVVQAMSDWRKEVAELEKLILRIDKYGEGNLTLDDHEKIEEISRNQTEASHD